MNIQELIGSGGGCFVKGTKLSTPKGEIDISEIKKGDLVFCFDDKLVKYAREVEDVFTHEGCDVYKYTFWNSRSITCTPVHAFLNQFNAFKEIGLFDSQDFVRDENNNLLPFIKSEYIGKSRVYNLHVKEFHTYIADGILVHNGGGGKSSGGNAYYEAPNTAQSTTKARLLEIISCGPIYGLVEGAKSIYLDETPLISQNGTQNYSGISWEQRTGTSDQSIITGFEDISSEASVAVEITYSSPVTRRIQTENIQAIIIKIQVPNGLSYMNVEANQLVGTSVSLDIHISYDGGAWIKLGTVTFSEKTTSAYEKDFYFNIDNSEEVDIRITRLTADSVNVNLNNATAWAGYTLLSGYKLNYPNIALMGYTVDAQEFGSNLPTRYVHARGLIVDVPSNYDPITRTYSGLWDGTFKKAYTNNGAWFLWWLLTDRTHGIGVSIPEWSLEETKLDLYEIAKYNDELVPDGFGGLEPRFTFNAWIVERQNAFTFLRTVAGTMNTIVFWDGENIKFSQDRPKDIEHIFNNTNVLDGKFYYTQIELSSKHSTAYATYNDMTDYGKAATESDENLSLLHQIGNVPLDYTVLGCNSRGQAKRSCRYHLAVEDREDWLVNFGVSLANCMVQPGDIIGIADDERQGVPYSGQIVKTEGKTLYLNIPIEFKSIADYTVMVTLSNGTVQNFTVENPMITTDTINVVEDLRASIVNGASWVLMSTELVPTEWRVLSITEDTQTTFAITAMKYDRYKFDYIEYQYSFPEPPTSLLPSGEILPPYNLKVFEYLYKQTNNTILSAAIFSWTPKYDSRVAYYEVQVLTPQNTVFKEVGRYPTLSVEITDLLRGDYIFQVRAVSTLGLKSVWAKTSVVILGTDLPLPDVTGFTTVFVEDRYWLIWNPVDDPRNFDYQIRLGSSWDNSQILAQIKENRYPLPGAGVYHIKAVYQNAQSNNPATLEREDALGQGIVHNVIAVIDEASDKWNGHEEGFQYLESINAIRMDVGVNFYGIEDFYGNKDFYLMGYTGEEAIYTVLDEKSVEIIGNHSCNISMDLQAYAELVDENFYGVEDFYGNDDFYGSAGLTSWKVQPEIMVRDNTVWGEWATFFPNKYVGDGFKFRLKAVANSATTVYITKFTISVDVPDKKFLFTGLQVSAEGTRINFDPPFSKIVNITGTLEGSNGTEDIYTIPENTFLDHAIIYVKDSSGNFIDKKVNLTVQGY